MERIIRTLREMKEKHEKAFIKNSIIAKQSTPNSPIRNAQDDLDMIIELGNAISFFENKPKAVESVVPEMAHLIGVLKYAIEETGRISGDHDGNVRFFAHNDSYAEIAKDYIENKTNFVFETKPIGKPSEGHTITDVVDTRIFKSEADKKKYFEDLAMSLHNMVMGGCTVSNLKDVLIRKFDWLKM